MRHLKPRCTVKGRVDKAPDGGWFVSWGAIYTSTVFSDSGEKQQGDLSAILVKENVMPKPGEASQNIANVVFTPVSDQKEDTNSFGYTEAPDNTKEAAKQLAIKDMKKYIDGKSGKQTITDLQYYMFKDNRTGAMDKDGKPIIYIIANSGFKIEKLLEKKDSKYYVTVTRTAQIVGDAQPGGISKEDSKPQPDEIK